MKYHTVVVVATRFRAIENSSLPYRYLAVLETATGPREMLVRRSLGEGGCGASREEALAFLHGLEIATRPQR